MTLKSANILKNKRALRRKRHVRRRLRDQMSAPRLSVHRTCKHISAQVIDDITGRTLAAATSTSKAVAGDLSGKTKTECAAHIGAEIARKAKEAGVESVVFDRGYSKYHGRVKALAEAAREGGLKF
jgi:large subunit ribosomal protein L18